jgi:hypothetical protein
VIVPSLSASKIGSASRKAQAALDEAPGETEALGDAVDVARQPDEILERPAFLGRRHLELVEVGRRRSLGQGRLVTDQDLHGNVIGLRVDHAALGEQAQAAQAATAIEHLEGAARFPDGGDEKVLQDAARFEIGRHLRDFEQFVGSLADVDGRKRELGELNGCGHGKELHLASGSSRTPAPSPFPFPDWLAANRRAAEPPSDRLSASLDFYCR